MFTAPDRLLVLGDTHHNIASLRHATHAAVAADVTALFVLGDFGYFPGSDFAGDFADQVADLLASSDLDCYFIDGNHDNIDALRALPRDAAGFATVAPRLYYVPRAHLWTWHGVRCLAAGGAVSVDRATRTAGYNWWPDEVLGYAEVNACIDAGPVDLLFAHDCPAGSAADSFDPTKGDRDSAHSRAAIAAIVEATTPALVLHGHYHHRASSIITLANGPVVVESLGADHAGADQRYLLDLTTFRH
jgi:UDP-2,3-diacylglucosamine pyrophosphatase LpxH